MLGFGEPRSSYGITTVPLRDSMSVLVPRVEAEP